MIGESMSWRKEAKTKKMPSFEENITKSRK